MTRTTVHRIAEALAVVLVLATVWLLSVRIAGADTVTPGWYPATDPIECWVPQAPDFHVLTDAEIAGWRNVDQAGYQQWRATSVRQRARDGLYEVLMRSDQGSAPWCVQVLPGLWVAQADAPAVEAYLASLNQ